MEFFSSQLGFTSQRLSDLPGDPLRLVQFISFEGNRGDYGVPSSPVAFADFGQIVLRLAEG